jgi:hypothetical protein
MIYDRVLNEAIEQDKALKVVTNNLNIFIFSSHLLPPDDRRMLLENLSFCINFRMILLFGQDV